MEVMVAIPRFNTPKGEIPLGSSEVNLLGSRPPELSRKGSAGVTENPLVPNKQTNKQTSPNLKLYSSKYYGKIH